MLTPVYILSSNLYAYSKMPGSMISQHLGRLVASDQKHRYLSSFIKWINETTFYPLLGMTDITVTLRVEVATFDLFIDDSCRVCREKAAECGVVEAVNSFNWEGIADIDLEKIVSLNGAFMFVWHIHICDRACEKLAFGWEILQLN